MALSSTSRPAIRGRVLSRLPATLTATGGLKVEKLNGNWTFSPDWTVLVELPTIADPAGTLIWTQTPLTGVFNTVSLETLMGTVLAIPAIADLDMGSHKIINLADGTAPGDAINKGQADADYQPIDATLTSISALGTIADRLAYTTGVDQWAETPLTATARSLLDDTSASAMRATLGVVIGTDVQAQDATLQSLSALGTATDRLAYTTNVDEWAETPLTAAARSVLDDASTSAMRTTLGVAIGADVQAFHARLANISGITYAQGDILYFDGTNLVKLAKGTDGQFLKITATIPQWAALAGGGDMLAANNLSDVANAATSRANIGLEIGVDVQPFDADILHADVSDNLTVGYTTTSFNNGTKTTGTFTPDPASGNIQHYVNGGAHTLSPPSSSCTIILECVNASAGALTTSGFTIVDGDTYSSAGTRRHILYITKTNSVSHLNVRYVTGT